MYRERSELKIKGTYRICPFRAFDSSAIAHFPLKHAFAV